MKLKGTPWIFTFAVVLIAVSYFLSDLLWHSTSIQGTARILTIGEQVSILVSLYVIFLGPFPLAVAVLILWFLPLYFFFRTVFGWDYKKGCGSDIMLSIQCLGGGFIMWFIWSNLVTLMKANLDNGVAHALQVMGWNGDASSWGVYALVITFVGFMVICFDMILSDN